MIKTPYDDIAYVDPLTGNTSSPTTGGTWVHTGTGPAAPVTFNGTIDFTGFPDGVYEYTYSVNVGVGCTPTATVSYDIGTGTVAVNDVETGAIELDWPYNQLSTIIQDPTNVSQCSTGLVTLSTNIAIPATWTPNNPSNDLWYVVNYVPGISSTMPATWLTTIYSGMTGGMMFPQIAVYDETLTLLGANDTAGNIAASVNSLTEDFTQPFTRYIRVASQTGSEGFFWLTVQRNI